MESVVFQRRPPLLSSPLSSSRLIFMLSFVSILHLAGLSPSHLPFLMTVHGYNRFLFFYTCEEQNFQWIVEAFPGDTVRASCGKGAAKTIPADLTSTICNGSFKTACPLESQVSYRTVFPTAPADFQFFESFDKAKITLHIPSNLQRPYPTVTFGWQGSPNSNGESTTGLITVRIKDKDPDSPPDHDTDSPTNPDSPSTNPDRTPSTPGGKPSSTVGLSPSRLSYAAFFFSSLLACSSFSGWSSLL